VPDARTKRSTMPQRKNGERSQQEVHTKKTLQTLAHNIVKQPWQLALSPGAEM